MKKANLKVTNAKDFYKKALMSMKWISEKSKDSLSYLAGINRPIYPAQVTKLAASLNKMGIIRPIVVAEIEFITGKKTKYIIDGQHLFNALLRLGFDIPYVTIQIKDKQELVETIALLNASSKTWSLVDYITAWASLKEDYVKLNHYFQVYDLDMGVVASVLCNLGSDGGNTAKKIKDGTFTIVNEKENVRIL
jgi:hypothetical protein